MQQSHVGHVGQGAQVGGFIIGEPVFRLELLAPGERITEEIISYIEYAKEKGCLLTGTEDMHVEKINVVLE